jgi:hypothetical protein
MKVKVGSKKLIVSDGKEEYEIKTFLNIFFSLYYHTVIPFLLVLFAIYTFRAPPETTCGSQRAFEA